MDKGTHSMVSANCRRCQFDIYLELKPTLNAILEVPSGFSVCVAFFSKRNTCKAQSKLDMFRDQTLFVDAKGVLP